MACVLHDLGEGLNLLQRVIAGTLHQTFDRQSPLVEIDVGIGNVVIVVRKLLKGSDVVVAVGLRQAMAAEQPGQRPSR